MAGFDAVLRAAKKRPLFVPGPGARAVDFGRADVEQMVPHREPFLFVDGIRAFDATEEAVLGYRRIDPADPVFRGHFPGEPIYPGVLLLETMAQLSLCLWHLCNADRRPAGSPQGPARVRLLRILDASFLAEVRPGDRLEIAARMVEEGGYTAVMAGQILRGETICAVGALEAFLPEE